MESWKEIAAFFARDERTVRRWEKECALPIHRVPGGAKGRVFAYENELNRWLSTPQASSNSKATAQEPAQVSVDRRSGTQILRWAVTLTVCALLAGGVIAYRKTHRFSVDASSSTAHTPASPEAEDFYLKGRFYWNQRTPESLNKALDYFMQAIVRDPAYADAYVGLADCYNLLREFGAMPPNEAYPRALAAAQKAIELNPNSAEAHTSLAFASFWGFIRVADAEREFQRALALDPQSAHIHHWHATFLAELGRFPEALAEIDRAQKLDPSSKAILADKGFVLAMSGKAYDAIILLKQLEATAPDFTSVHFYLVGTYFDQGEYVQYFDEAQTLAQLEHDTNTLHILERERKAFANGGAKSLLDTRLHEDLKLYRRGLKDDFNIAADYALLGRKDEAVRALDRAYQNHDLALCTLRVHRDFRRLRDDPEFRAMVVKVGLPGLS
ncbi:MAG TPA: tetratricopeptide repeat protein [Terriglobia bacterium]|nr:tetratricopeptide repeat protein [Terriglobia bacterium]